MNVTKRNWLGRMWKSGLTPGGFLVRATLIVVFFVACHLAGWREHTTFLSGTATSADGSVNASILLGVVYMAAYFGLVLLAPILALAAGLLFAFERLASRRADLRIDQRRSEDFGTANDVASGPAKVQDCTDDCYAQSQHEGSR